MEWLKLGSVGCLLLAAYLIVIGAVALIGGTAIPAWFIGLLAIGAGVLILVGK